MWIAIAVLILQKTIKSDFLKKLNNIHVYVEFYESYDQLDSTNCSWTTLGTIQNYFFRVINFFFTVVEFCLNIVRNTVERFASIFNASLTFRLLINLSFSDENCYNALTHNTFIKVISTVDKYLFLFYCSCYTVLRQCCVNATIKQR